MNKHLRLVRRFNGSLQTTDHPKWLDGQSPTSCRNKWNNCGAYITMGAMSRTVDEKRPGELRQVILKYLVTHGLADLSLRPLAKAIGCSPRVLIYHFESKERMIAAVLAEIRLQQRRTFSGLQASTLEDACIHIWQQMTAPDSERLFRLFFEAYGIALRTPKSYRDFLHETMEEWLQFIADDLRSSGYERAEATAIATTVLAGLRGFMLDFCTTHQRDRLDKAIKLWAATLPLPRKQARKRGADLN